MDIKTTIERLKDYKKDKEEKQRLEKEMYEKECEKYKNIILSMSNEMDEMLELEKIAMESLDGTKLNEFYKTKTAIKYDIKRDSMGNCYHGFKAYNNNCIIGIYRVVKYEITGRSLKGYKLFVENFEKFKQEKIEYVNKVLDGKI